MKNNLLAILLIGVLLTGAVAAEESYVEALQNLKTQVATSEKNIRDDIGSFNAAFQDTFRLVDDEISRLIVANAAMVGIIFAIMFLVYAKTTSRTKRDLQVLLAAHAKHIDTVVSKRLDDFESRIDNKMRARDPSTQSKLGSDFDGIVGALVETDAEFAPKRGRLARADGEMIPIDEAPKQEATEQAVPKEMPKERSIAVATSRAVEKIAEVEEAKLDKDGKVKILKDTTSPLNKVRKRLKRGILRLLGKGAPKEKIQEFKK